MVKSKRQILINTMQRKHLLQQKDFGTTGRTSIHNSMKFNNENYA